MVKQLTAFIILLFPFTMMGQDLELITPLDDIVKESSGLIFLNGRLITHNDSGGEARLYEIDSLTGNVTRTVTILNSTNKDWEDLTFDETYIYIGDFGNNFGSRTDLKVYRILRSEFFESPDNTATAELIHFHYTDQTDFSSTTFSTNYDAEAFISLGDSLYIFTKNWGDSKTHIYPLPKIPGDYALVKTDSIDIGGLVTSADYNEDNGQIILSCYTLLSPFAVFISGFDNGHFSQGEIVNYNLHAPVGYSHQIEGVARMGNGLFYFTSEGGFFGSSGLYRLNMNPTGIIKREVEVFSLIPNPASDHFVVKTSEKITVKIYSTSGDLVQVTKSKSVDVSKLPAGTYLVEIRGSDDQLLAKQRLVVI